MYHHGVTILWIFLSGFSDCDNVLLPRQRTLSQPITLELFVSNVTPKIKCVRAYLTYVTSTELLSGLKILWMHDEYSVGRFGIIPVSWDLEC